MKKVLSILLSVLLFVPMFSGCAGEPEPLRICVDLEYTGQSNTAAREIYDLIQPLETAGKLKNVEVECIPASGVERETALDRIRTEIMSGDGPDVFIMAGARVDGALQMENVLFPMPEKNMEAALFLPLDEYIENQAEYAEWEKFTKVIMDAGKNEEGQQLIPLVYTLPVAVYRASDVEYVPNKEMTWDDVLQDEQLYAVTAPVADGVTEKRNQLLVDFNMDSVLGKLADHTEEKLLFSEEELRMRVDEIFAMQEYSEQQNIFGQTGWYEGYLGRGFNCTISTDMNGVYENDLLSIVPISSDDGGYTAAITSFAAVNRNTKRPKDAFVVIDRLVSKSMMQNSALYENTLYGSTYGIPMHEDVMSVENELYLNRYHMSAENFAVFSAVRDNITAASFSGVLHTELDNLLLECSVARENGEPYEDIVRRGYINMKRMMGE